MKCLLLVLIVSFFLISCGSDDEASGNDLSVSLAFAQDAANSLPQMKPVNSFRGTGNISSTGLYNFFKQECYMPSADGTSYDGFCPADVNAELDAALAGNQSIGDGSDLFNAYKLTSGSLIGLIYHAQMYSQGPGFSNNCASYEASDLVTAHAPAFLGGTSDPDKYVLDYFDTLYCVKANSWDGNTMYSTFGYDETATSLSNLTARYRAPYNGVADPGQTDIFQVYVAIDSTTKDAAIPTATLMAFNYTATGDDTGARSIILTNLVDHKFAVRYTNSHSDRNEHIIAMGIGGVDKTTGAAVAGYYMVKHIVTDVANTTVTSSTSYCVDNETGTYNDAVYTDCTDSGITWPITASSQIETYLNISAADSTNLTNFLSFFEDSDQMDATLFPGASLEADTNFPRTIQ